MIKKHFSQEIIDHYNLIARWICKNVSFGTSTNKCVWPISDKCNYPKVNICICITKVCLLRNSETLTSTQSVSHVLYVDDFDVKYRDKEHANHLLLVLRKGKIVDKNEYN